MKSEAGKMGNSEKRELRIFQIPIAINEFAAIQLPCAMKETEWHQMLKVLEAMRPALIENGSPGPC